MHDVADRRGDLPSLLDGTEIERMLVDAAAHALADLVTLRQVQRAQPRQATVSQPAGSLPVDVDEAEVSQTQRTDTLSRLISAWTRS